MNTSKDGLLFIKANEGFKLKPYKDTADVLTIGVGHKILPGEVFPETGITEDQVLELLAKDVGIVEAALNSFLKRNKLTLSQNQFDVLIDFSFNLGAGSLLLLLSHGLSNVPTEIIKWCNVNHKFSEGLYNRRLRELDLWNKTDFIGSNSDTPVQG